MALELALTQPGGSVDAQIVHCENTLSGVAEKNFLSFVFNAECFALWHIRQLSHADVLFVTHCCFAPGTRPGSYAPAGCVIPGSYPG